MNLTTFQLIRACREHNYLAARFSSGIVMGVNCKIAGMSKFSNLEDIETDIQSYNPISFQEYISIKHSFYRKHLYR